MEDLTLFELNNSLDLIIDLLLLQGKDRVDSKQILFEPVDAVIREVLVYSILGEEELKLQEQSNELIIPDQLLPLGLISLVQDILLHHVLVVLFQDVLNLFEVLLPAVCQVLPRDFAATLDELFLEVDAFFQGFVLFLIVGAVESIGVFGVWRHPAVSASLC